MVGFTILLVCFTKEAVSTATVTLSSKHQITLPVDLVRGLNLKPGDRLVVELIDDHLVVMAQPSSWVEYFAGSLKGVYGHTVEEVDRYIAEVRHGWDIDALKDALAGDGKLRAMYESIPSSLQGIRLSTVMTKTKTDMETALRLLDRLIELKAIKQIPLEFDPERKQADQMYRRIP